MNENQRWFVSIIVCFVLGLYTGFTAKSKIMLLIHFLVFIIGVNMGIRWNQQKKKRRR